MDNTYHNLVAIALDRLDATIRMSPSQYSQGLTHTHREKPSLSAQSFAMTEAKDPCKIKNQLRPTYFKDSQADTLSHLPDGLRIRHFRDQSPGYF